MGSGTFELVPHCLFVRPPGVVCKMFSATSVAFPEPLVPRDYPKFLRMDLEGDNLDQFRLSSRCLVRR